MGPVIPNFTNLRAFAQTATWRVRLPIELSPIRKHLVTLANGGNIELSSGTERSKEAEPQVMSGAHNNIGRWHAIARFV